MTRSRRAAVALAPVVVAVAGAVAGCSVGPLLPRAVAHEARPTDPSATTVVAVGDSVTAMYSPDFADGVVDSSSWAWWADGRGVDVVGGWAVWGATTEDMLDGVDPMHADVLVLLAGNNDVDLEVPTPEVLDNLVAIAARVGVPRVVLSAVAPEDGLGHEVGELNVALAQLAQQQGWQFVDPMTDVRAGDGDYRDGTTLDGVHPTEEASARIGVALHEAVLHPGDVSDPAPVPPA